MATLPLGQGNIMIVAYSKKLISLPPHTFIPFSFFKIVGVSFFTTLKFPNFIHIPLAGAHNFILLKKERNL